MPNLKTILSELNLRSTKITLRLKFDEKMID